MAASGHRDRPSSSVCGPPSKSSTGSGDALDPPGDARRTKRGGVEYRTFRHDGRTVVTWERGGHTCVLSSERARPAELIALADWRGKGAIPF